MPHRLPGPIIAAILGQETLSERYDATGVMCVMQVCLHKRATGVLALMLLGGLVSLVAGIAQPSPALAETVDVSSSIAQVTVFPRGAEVVRRARVTVDEGDHVLVLDDLPEQVVRGSVRVDGDATGDLRIGAVDTEVEFVTSDSALGESERKRLEEELERLGDRLSALEGAIKVAETQRQMMSNLANLPQPVVGGGATVQPLDPDRLGAIFQLIGERMLEADATIQNCWLEGATSSRRWMMCAKSWPPSRKTRNGARSSE